MSYMQGHQQVQGWCWLCLAPLLFCRHWLQQLQAGDTLGSCPPAVTLSLHTCCQCASVPHPPDPAPAGRAQLPAPARAAPTGALLPSGLKVPQGMAQPRPWAAPGEAAPSTRCAGAARLACAD